MNTINNEAEYCSQQLIDPLTSQKASQLYIKGKGIYVWDTFTQCYRSTKNDASLLIPDLPNIVWELSC